ELVLPERGLLRGRAQEVRARVENVVPKKFDQASVQLVRAGLGDYVDVHAHISAILRRVSSGLDFDFLYGVHGRPRGRGADQVVDDPEAVGRDAVGDFTRARADEVLARGRAVGGLEPADGSRRHYRELERVAAVQGEIGDVARADDL